MYYPTVSRLRSEIPEITEIIEIGTLADFLAVTVCGDCSPRTTGNPSSYMNVSRIRGMGERGDDGAKLGTVPHGKKQRQRQKVPPSVKNARKARQNKPRPKPVMCARKQSAESVSAVRQTACVCGKHCETKFTDADIGALRSCIWDKTLKQQDCYLLSLMRTAGEVVYSDSDSQDCEVDECTDATGNGWRHRCIIRSKPVRGQPGAVHSKRARLLVQAALHQGKREQPVKYAEMMIDGMTKNSTRLPKTY